MHNDNVYVLSMMTTSVVTVMFQSNSKWSTFTWI